MSAGAIAAGVEVLREAVGACREAGETDLEAAALLAFGSALVHATKGKDEEGAAALHRSIAAAEATGDRAIAAAAHRELGYVEMLRGDYLRARTLVRSAEALADGDPTELSRIRAVSGAALADVGSHDQAKAEFEDSIRLAEEAGLHKQRAWSLAVLGRTHLLRNELERAGGRADGGSGSHEGRALDRRSSPIRRRCSLRSGSGWATWIVRASGSSMRSPSGHR